VLQHVGKAQSHVPGSLFWRLRYVAVTNYYATCQTVIFIIFTARCNFSAKRGIAIACRLSVRLSVCNVGEL